MSSMMSVENSQGRRHLM